MNRTTDQTPFHVNCVLNVKGKIEMPSSFDQLIVLEEIADLAL